MQPGMLVMTTGKALLPLNQSATDIQPARSGADVLQFAGLLLGTTSQAGVRTILFACASENTPARRVIYEAAVALRVIRGCRVALILLSDIPPANGAQESTDSREGSLSRDWTVSENNGLTTFGWNHSLENGRAPVPASAFADLARTLQERFDFILIDAGTVGASPQPILLAPYCAATVLLVQPGITTVAEVHSSQALLSQAQARLLGFAFVESA